MRVGRHERRPFWVGVTAGFALGVLFAFAGTLGLGLLAAHLMKGAVVLPPPAIPAERGSTQGRMPLDWSIATLDGAPVALDSLAGRVLFIHRWATWCGPCVEELPELAALYDSVRGDGVTFLTLSDEEPGTIRDFLGRRRVRLPAFRSMGPVPPELAAPGLPVTFVIDREGWIRLRQVGAAAWDRASVRGFLRGLAGEGADPATSAPAPKATRRP